MQVTRIIAAAAIGYFGGPFVVEHWPGAGARRTPSGDPFQGNIDQADHSEWDNKARLALGVASYFALKMVL